MNEILLENIKISKDLDYYLRRKNIYLFLFCLCCFQYQYSEKIIEIYSQYEISCKKLLNHYNILIEKEETPTLTKIKTRYLLSELKERMKYYKEEFSSEFNSSIS